ncbi:MAG: four helix bundle protein [Candidatus Yonathbacteria bacterium]|nr:four helix bundle protein [Candidatus Yonathbacteria bacterium]
MNIENKETIKDFTDLRAWQEGHTQVVEIYTIVKSFPKEELFGLSSQMRRCAVSITSNIAEGFSRTSYKDKIHFYVMAQGSLTEPQNQLLIARDTSMLEKSIFDKLYAHSISVHKIISGLIKTSRSHASLHQNS